MTSLSDIAKLTGYSKATVSRVLSGNGYASKKACEEILKTAADLDYATNAIAQELAHGATRNIGVVLPYIKAPFFSKILEGILEKSFETGYKIIILPSNYNEELEIQYLEKLRKKAFEAIIFTSRQVSEETILKYQKYGPIVLCHRPNNRNIPATYANRIPAYREAFQWLKAQGCTNIGFLLSRGKSPTISTTLQAYRDVYKRDANPEQIKSGLISPEDAYQLSPELTQFDGIFANSDEIAANVWRWFDEQKLSKPIIVGQERLLSGQLLKLPTVDNHCRKVGRMAFEQALSQTIEQSSINSEFILER
ncbi:LacI family DNA-binding transcriptional regulator [Lactococcus garvieae]|jgi:DNA-binding LacI/PurR family transcriptional regulator|uniref:Transcription regulator n=1 Tax=Lactococcus garvieae DCC43 TaxID=1231377 RepID=K2NTB8_9LACT|nr:LacI family DNA-binding transcriptional regulator [Lactococcus garvieae]EKF50838.1 transcription regulator [Lactococcus garvieae DCC43]